MKNYNVNFVLYNGNLVVTHKSKFSYEYLLIKLNNVSNHIVFFL